MEAKHTRGPLSVRMNGTCSGAWAEIVQECIDPDSGEPFFRELARTETTHAERHHANGRPLRGMPGDINEKPERFRLMEDGEELIANAHLWAAAPELLEALQAVLRSFPTDGDMHAAGLEQTEIDLACRDYEAARAAVAKATQ